VFLRSNNKYIRVIPDDILFIESSGNYLKMVMKDEVISIRGTFSSIMEIIPKEGFVQVHRSFIVAQKHIKSIEANQIIIGDKTVPVGKYFKAQLDNLLK